jgi:hypothetical protein
MLPLRPCSCRRRRGTCFFFYPSRWSCRRRWEDPSISSRTRRGRVGAAFVTGAQGPRPASVEVPPSLSESRRRCRGGREEEGPLRVGCSCARHMDELSMASGAWAHRSRRRPRSAWSGWQPFWLEAARARAR